jgi:hypothetical protein
MKNTVQRLALGVFVLVVAAFAPTALFAAPGDLYSGGLSSPRAITEFTPAGTPTTFVSNIFADPLAFDAKGNLFVGNTEANTIIKITPDKTRTTFATGINSTGLAFDASGNLYATDSLTNAIYKFTPGGTPTFVSSFSQPFGVAVDPSGNLFVSLTSNTIVKIPPGGSPATFAMGLNSPEGLATDRLGNLYVADFGSGSVFKFDPSGTTKTTFASGLSAPRQLTLDDAGNVFVAVHGTQQILKFGPAGGTPTVFASSTNAGGLAFERPTAQLANISTRASVQTGQGVTIAGFIVTGPESKQVIIRGLGPTLTQSNVPGALQDPTLDLHDASSSIQTNDNWKDTQQAEIQATGLAPQYDAESAILRTLAPGAYTAILAGKNNGTGIGLVEVYDVSAGVFAELTNVSTRGFVGTHDAVMIGGFITSGGNGFTEVIVRGIGPSLAQAHITGFLADPYLELRDVNGTVVRSNRNWKDTQQADIQATGLAPSNDLESAILVTVPAGSYTAILQGDGGGTGIGLVEIFKVR